MNARDIDRRSEWAQWMRAAIALGALAGCAWFLWARFGT
jgi:hypothetical protein